MVAALPCLIGSSHSALPLFALVLGADGYGALRVRCGGSTDGLETSRLIFVLASVLHGR